MAESLTKVSGEEFIVKLLSGERNFSKIFLEERFDLSGHSAFQELKMYLEAQNLQEEPVDISNSQLQYVKARGLYLPFTVGRNANFRGAILEYAIFENANFENANFGNANLKGTNFKNAYLVNADFWIANLRSVNLELANFEGAYLKGAYFGGANLKNVRNLTEVVNLGKEYLLEKK